MAKKNNKADKKDGKKVIVKKKDTEEPKAVEVPAEMKPEEVTKVEAPAEQEAPKEEEPKVEGPVRPVMPEGYCLTAADWDGNEKNLHDPHSENCQECLSESPERFEACRTREVFLGAKPTTKKVRGERTVKANGEKPQSIQLDELIKANTKYEDMVAKFGKARVISHIRAIRTGKYCRADGMKESVAYLPKV